MHARTPWMIGLGSWLLGGALGCGPQVQIEDGSSGDDGSPTTTTSTTIPPGDTTAMATVAVTTTPMTTTEGLDDGPRPDLPPDVGAEECIDWATMGCGAPSPRGVVTAVTPLGDFEATLAVFGGQAGCGCPGMLGPNIERIVLAADPTLLQGLEPYGDVDETLAIELHMFEGPLGVPTYGAVRASRDGVSISHDVADVVIDVLPSAEQVYEPFDPMVAAVVTGSVSLEAPGWSVAGTFAATYCPDINGYYICE